ncbi:DMT family transporter [Salinispira pacifica]|uniref:EamA domain-containing protein n=1 Tax=Salinispira pacifica TaxID=1307761 RepID=V5WKJ0_9SPIO|nr:DMT family transporter [Salinispira pacifica]AHC16268.1 hypothetical protein L21SP2_2922 [Salinispira pacifica]
MIWGVLLALGAAGAWAHNSIFYTFSGRRVGSGTTAHIRLWIALPVSLLIQLMITGSFLPVLSGGASLAAAAVSGLFGYVVADLLLFRAFLDIGPRDTMLIMTGSPLFAALFSWLMYGERLAPGTGAAALLILSGIAMVVRDTTPAKTGTGRPDRKGIGVLLAIAGAVSQALGIVASKYSINAGDSPVEINVVRLLAGLLGLLVYVGFRGTFFQDFRKMKDRRALGFIAFAAVVGPSLGVMGSLYAVMFIPVGLAAVLMQTTPLFLFPVEHLLFRRKITLWGISGTVLSLSGITLLLLL